MPTRLPDKPRARSIRISDHRVVDERVRPSERRNQHAVENIDWLAIWALSIAFCAIVLAGIVYFTDGDVYGASTILAGAAVIVAVALRASKMPSDAD